MNEVKLLYDEASLPEGLTAENMIHCVENSGIVWYNSEKGMPPIVVNKALKIEIIDISEKDDTTE